MPHTIKMFETFIEKVDGKPKLQSRSLGELALDDTKNNERRKQLARDKAEKHVGRRAENVSHATDGSVVVTFKKGG